MTENMKKFLEKVSPHGELAKRIQPMTNGQIIHMAQEMDISLTVKDFEESEQDVVLDEEPSWVAGGSKCGGVWGGAGNGGDGHKKCTCWKNGSSKFGGSCDRCSCAAFGEGATK